MTHRIAILSRYPPLEGGIASKTYWLARGLAARGHEVHVITHPASAAAEYRIPDNGKIGHELPNLWVHRPEVNTPWHLPEDEEYLIALLDLTLEVVRRYGIEVIDTGYLVPYGVIGHLAKRLTGAHHVLRHGGSDIEKFLKRKLFSGLLTEAISSADVVVTVAQHKDLLHPFNRNTVTQPAYIPDATAFVRRNASEPPRRLAVIGKINYHWRHKSLHTIAEIMARLAGQFECWVIGQGNGLQDFQSSLDKEVVSALQWRPFVLPWEMPGLLDHLDAIFVLESRLPHPVISNLALEAMCVGLGIITDRQGFASTYQGIVKVGNDQVLVITPSEPYLAAEQISRWVQDRAWRQSPAHQLVSHEDYVSMNEELYDSHGTTCCWASY